MTPHNFEACHLITRWPFEGYEEQRESRSVKQSPSKRSRRAPDFEIWAYWGSAEDLELRVGVYHSGLAWSWGFGVKVSIVPTIVENQMQKQNRK